MASLTLDDARSVVRDYIDGVNDTTRFPNGTLDRHLKGALSALLGVYVKRGDDRLVEVLASSTDASGHLSLSTSDPVDIRGVALVSGTARVSIGRIASHERGTDHAAVESLEVSLVRKFDIPAVSSNPLVYHASAASTAMSFEAFDHLVCIYAALALSTKDKERRQDLEALRTMYEDAVFSRPPTVTTREPVRGNVRRPSIVYWYDAGNRRICLSNAVL